MRNILKYLRCNGQCYFSTYTKVKMQPKSIRRSDNQLAIIECKRQEYNIYHVENNPYAKFGTIPLASNGWLHKKSKGDWFHIKPTITAEEKQQELIDWNAAAVSAIEIDVTLKENLKALDIKKLTHIQCMAWPKIFDNNHVLLAAETGCGKTLAYLVPIVQSIMHRKSKSRESDKRKMNTPLCIILTPSRELAIQVGNVASKLCNGSDVQIKTILGGNTKRLMLNPEFEDIDILVSSMGAISKLVTTGIYHVNHVRHVVLDEADTLLDDSFSDKLTYFLKRFPFHRNHMQTDVLVGTQLVLATATMPTNIEELLGQVVNVESIRHVVSPNLHKLLPHVEQRFMRVNKSERPAHLLGIVKKELSHARPIIIFSNKTPTCDYVDIFLNNAGVKCVNLNGDMLMKIRLGRFEMFQNGECDVLSTTDMGSRGLDTTRARNVINFDFPLHYSDYIHRAGRIGRVGNLEKCVVTNLISSRREIDIVQRIEHAARTGGLLLNVNANIKSIINARILKDMEESGLNFQQEAF